MLNYFQRNAQDHGDVSLNVGFTLNWTPSGALQSAKTLTSCREAAFAGGRCSAARKMCLLKASLRACIS